MRMSRHPGTDAFFVPLFPDTPASSLSTAHRPPPNSMGDGWGGRSSSACTLESWGYWRFAVRTADGLPVV